MSDKKIKIGITHGDINGISYEVIIKTFQDSRIYDFCTPVIYGSPKVAAYHKKALNVINFNFNTILTAGEAVQRKANIINVLDDNIRVELGKSTPMAGESALISLEQAVKDLQEGKIDVLVTAPLNRENTQNETLNFKGHTKFLMEKFNTNETLILMTSELMKVGVVSGHVPLSEVSEHITEENILKKLRILNKTLIEDFAIRKPKIAVLGLNPHAGDSGKIGKEEVETIIPTVDKANAEGILALGPFSADGFFGSDSFRKFDAILAMYHDQGIAPFKALNFDNGVTYTAGLPIVRTTPDQGMEYEIAGLDKASPNSFREAIFMACSIYKNRKDHSRLTANPLLSYDVSDK
ncbi:MAG: 4-hydroxythreonine-4-phosphate dehydrogenase PdxA [Salinivirgaceae bacterium]|jgi:4-hydroxythreonine-4-phosphate dehydrogenase|nr:4-hydroxythreonine-4-phosphate dehydrogenase PdxA [Salinivirgaceae bacterium]